MSSLDPNILIEATLILYPFLTWCRNHLVKTFSLRVEVALVGSTHYLFVSGLGSVVANVPTDCVVEEHWFLTDNSQTCPQVVNIVVFYVVPIN